MKITNKSSHFLPKLKFLAIFATSGEAESLSMNMSLWSPDNRLSAGKV